MQAGVWVMLLHPRADELPCPEMPHQGFWHLEASSQLPALSHPSLGTGSGNAAAFSGCLDFCLFLRCCFPGIPEKGLAGRAGCLQLTRRNPSPNCSDAVVYCALCTCSPFGENGTPKAQTTRFQVNERLTVISHVFSAWSCSFVQQQR